MRIFVTGGQGMAGHLITHYLRTIPHADVYSSIREPADHPKTFQLDLTDKKLTYEILKQAQPDFVINAAGILNAAASKRLKEAIYINTLLPHTLAGYGKSLGFKLIHISTDCVFSGLKGQYTEDHPTDGTTVYAKTKSLGEVMDSKHITIRTSIIGPEIRNQGIGLFHWFMQQKGVIEGYQQVFWNGVTTLELSKAIAWILQENHIGGLVHLAANDRISKYDLLCFMKEEFNKGDVQIAPNCTQKSDKTLLNTRKDFTYVVPDYKVMMKEIKDWMIENQHMYTSYLNFI